MGWGGVGWGMLTFVWTCWACLNLFEAEIALRLGEIHIYLENHQIQTSEFQSFVIAELCFRLGETLMMGWGGVGWGMLTFVWTCWGSMIFWGMKRTVFHDLTFRSAGFFLLAGAVTLVLQHWSTDSNRSWRNQDQNQQSNYRKDSSIGKDERGTSPKHPSLSWLFLNSARNTLENSVSFSFTF